MKRPSTGKLAPLNGFRSFSPPGILMAITSLRGHDGGLLLEEIGGGPDTGPWLGQLGRDIAGAGGETRSQHGTEVGEQPVLGGGRETTGDAHFEPLHLVGPYRLVGSDPQDKRRHACAHTRGRGARATVVHDCPAGGEHRRVIDRADQLDVVTVSGVVEIPYPGGDERTLPQLRAYLTDHGDRLRG